MRCEPTPSDLLLIWEAATRLGRSPNTVREWVRSGALPAAKLPGASGAYVIRAEDVEAFMAQPAAAK